ncbi:MAG TPA: vitamin K epoxide reductase family protein [Acidimicrobiales bacterium]|nr:vitamin K epoxide reductase family protein [Acidimicrobiales bacterium]
MAARASTRARPVQEAAPEAEEHLGLPRWLPWAASVLGLAGVGVSSYLTIAHYDSSVQLACSASGIVDCAKVTTSAQSKIVGIPVAVLGLAWFLAMTGINLPPAWRAASPWVARARLALAVSGIGFVLYLISAELLIIGAICVWCTSAHVLAFLLFMLVLSGTGRTGLGQRPQA